MTPSPDVSPVSLNHTPDSPAPTFAELGVRDEIVRGLADVGIDRTFAIQELTLPLALAGDDLIGQARTGMGKTFGFGVPLLHRITAADAERPLDGTPRALVIVPTRELCVQVTTDLQEASVHLGARVMSIYGGRPYEDQIATLQSGVDVVVGTPGRLLDLANQGHLVLGKVSVLVLDEADEMLDLGFLPDIERVLGMVPDKRQTMLFSATMPGPIITLARTFLTKPTHIRAEEPDSSAVHERTVQHVFRAHALDKVEMLTRILQARGRGATMIFTRTKRTAQKVADELAERGFKVGAVHGDLGQAAREKSLDGFRSGTVDVLVATDVAARGIDIDDVTHVINYQCPDDEKTYVHRIGRTGRAGRTGIAVTLVDWDDVPRWQLIDKALGLGIADPVETYSSSEHLFVDLDIPTDVTGKVGAATRATGSPRSSRNGDKRSVSGSGDTRRRADGKAAAQRNRSSRRRTRGAQSAGEGAAASQRPAGDGGTADASSEAKAGTGPSSAGPTQRRRRRRRSGGSASGGSAPQGSAAATD
ncbi:DEAD/DEAH box helicase [Tomitella fengzijianii]|uniref:DEAD/DEAH box helicase n=1 Tax=Tomitella fengzijianii TaxID=2597660 RepID=UPI001E4B42FB|nr:DEAD/DEAH box helicase [Tomitella fengzijianii]